ncbi:hypothetical protein RhiirA5_421125 [Rhizophagus irregularis]|uniref:Wax synthase domain-containing protein n=1 Tax=Rhizophagus irregularis TaxID=588596 RepID=A0A2N0PEK9_9GLOM|nr:hypothetical protein RhiirA5_421125 [Rhizophagus irregularis]
MSLDSQSKIFTKSNLIYIPLSITIAHTLNFIINSPLSTWKEFPPKLPNSVYSSVFFTPILLFISLTFEPIQTRKRFYTLLSLALLVISIPISYREKGYPTSLQNNFVAITMFLGIKMLLFLKFNRLYLDQKNLDQKKGFKSYISTLFNWRFNSYIIPPVSKNSNEKENPLIIKSPTTSQINKKLINRSLIVIAKYLIFEFCIFTLLISANYKTEIPKKAYQIRLIEFVTSGIPPFTISSLRLYLNFLGVIYLWLSLNYDIITIIAAIILRFIFHFTSEKNDRKSILIQYGILTPPVYVSIKEWLITFLFNTRHLFSVPFISSSPRDFWSTRWQLLLNESFKELGYLPVKNLFIPIFSRKISNIMGVLGAFGVSALLHEYIIIANFNIWTGEQFFFFMAHGVIFILWEAIFNSKNKDMIIEKFLKWFLLLIINLILLPALVEPSIRNINFSDISTISKHFLKDYM